MGAQIGEGFSDPFAALPARALGKDVDQLKWDGGLVSLTTLSEFSEVLGPDAKTLGTLTEAALN